MVGSSIDYSVAADLFTVKGIFKTGLFDFDAQSAFVNKPYLDTVMMSENKASYFTLNFHDNDHIDEATKALHNKLPIRNGSYQLENASLCFGASHAGRLHFCIYLYLYFFSGYLFCHHDIFLREHLYTRKRDRTFTGTGVNLQRHLCHTLYRDTASSHPLCRGRYTHRRLSLPIIMKFILSSSRYG